MRNKGPLLSRLTHANETKNATHTIIFLILVILRSFLFPSSIMVQLFWCFLNPEMAVGFVPLRAEVSLLHSVHEVICVACLSHSWFHCYISSVTSVNLKKAGMASRNIVIKNNTCCFYISFAVVFGLLVLGLFALRIQATRITSYTVADPDLQIKGGGGGGGRSSRP